MSKTKKNNKKSNGNWLKETLSVILLAVIMAVAVKGFVIDTRVIPSESMVPTIEVGDRVIISRFAYWFDAEPERGDIVVFKAPEEFGKRVIFGKVEVRDDLIKRVIGLPGDTVEVYDGYVYINGVPLAENYLNEQPDYTFGPVTVPDGSYWMLGDNRNESNDGHAWRESFVPEEDIKGKTILRYWPLDRFGTVD